MEEGLRDIEDQLKKKKKSNTYSEEVQKKRTGRMEKR